MSNASLYLLLLNLIHLWPVFQNSMLKFIETKQETRIVPTDEHLSNKITNFLRAFSSRIQPFVLKYSSWQHLQDIYCSKIEIVLKFQVKLFLEVLEVILGLSVTTNIFKSRKQIFQLDFKANQELTENGVI